MDGFSVVNDILDQDRAFALNAFNFLRRKCLQLGKIDLRYDLSRCKVSGTVLSSLTLLTFDPSFFISSVTVRSSEMISFQA